MTHVAHALADPMSSLPERAPGSIRRTSHLDVAPGVEGEMELSGEAREGADVVACRAVLGADRTLLTMELEPGGGAEVSARLVGRVVGRGFRSAVDKVCDPGTLHSALLTDLPVVALLSGYGTLYSGDLESPLTDRFIRGMPVDICAGWADTSFMMGHIRSQREIPTPDGPEVPTGSEGWHPMPDLAVGVLRRQRLIERTGNQVWGMFRDSYARPDGVTSVLHEYTVAATVAQSHDGSGGEQITACQATPRVLPWAECPQAAASAGRLVGQRLADLRSLVRDDLVGTSTCTHLNDLLSSLSQAERLV